MSNDKSMGRTLKVRSDLSAICSADAMRLVFDTLQQDFPDWDGYLFFEGAEHAGMRVRMLMDIGTGDLRCEITPDLC